MFIKGFDKDLRCRGFQFEVSKTYETGAADEDLKLCSDTVFHFCRSLQQVHDYYNVNNDNRYCEIEVLGRLIEDDCKCGSNKIRVVREISNGELQYLKGHNQGNTGLFNTGSRNVGDCNVGSRNVGDCNVGSRNVGDCNVGRRNVGDCNVGRRNVGDWNVGNWNVGNWNVGRRNVGDWNVGDWNKCDRSTGFFNTQERTVTIFNQDSGLTYDECCESAWHAALYSVPFELTKWIEYTEDDKKDSIIRQCIGGYLKKYTFKEACANWWNLMKDEDKHLIQTMPNFDKAIFKEITGIEVNMEEKQ